MERFEIGEDDRLAAMVDAATRGERVEITRGDEVVATVTVEQMQPPSQPARSWGADFRSDLEALHRSLPPDVAGLDWGAEISRMRDED